jgi:hypothetical protein
MPITLEIEDIEEMRRREGIDDVELRAEIRCLTVGAIVKLTFVTELRAFKTVPVRITQIRGMRFRGKLLQPALTLPRGKMVVFTFAHVHSVVKRPAVDV